MNKEPLTEAAMQAAVRDKLRERLSEAPWLKDVRIAVPSPRENTQLDFIARFEREGDAIALAVEVKRQVKPGDVPKLRQQLEKYMQPLRAGLKGEIHPMVAAPWISPRVAQLCREAHIGCMDLAGNMFLSVPGIHLHFAGFKNPYKAVKPRANLGSMESARVIRALLCWPQGCQTQWKLQERCQPGVSIGLVNKVVQHLREEAYLEENEYDGFKVKDPVGLLKAWAMAYRFEKHHRKPCFTLLPPKVILDKIKHYYEDNEFRTILASFSAADFQAPHVRQPKTWIYVTEDALSDFMEAIEAKPVDSGVNLEILIPADHGVFYESRRIGNNLIPQTHPVQTYVDLCHSGGRGEEAAEALLNQRLKPAWKAGGLNL